MRPMNTDDQSALVQRYPGYFINREFSTEHRNVTKLEIESTKWNCRERSLLPLISVTRYFFFRPSVVIVVHFGLVCNSVQHACILRDWIYLF